jgi:rubrerythrin
VSKIEIKDFLVRAMLNEQEQVRDYQRFALGTENEEVKKAFLEFAEVSGHTASRIKELVEKL